MGDLESILKNENISYNVVEKYLSTKDESILMKIINNIMKFDDDSKKKICENIIINTINKNLVDTVCREISIYIPFDYSYYKKILKIISSKKYEGRWITSLKRKILEKSDLVLQEIFYDLSLDKPIEIEYDLSIFQAFLDEYDKYFINVERITLSKEQALVICKRLNYILTIKMYTVLKLYFQFFNIFKFDRNDLDTFLKMFSFNYPLICKKFIKNESIDDSLFKDYLIEKNDKYDSDNYLKERVGIFKPNAQRLNEYQRRQFEQSNEVKEQAHKFSIFYNLIKHKTILYGRKYGMTIKGDKGKEVFVGNMKEISCEYYLPLEYIIDPIDYMNKVNNLRLFSKENQ